MYAQQHIDSFPDNKVYGANMGHTWGRQAIDIVYVSVSNDNSRSHCLKLIV